MAFSIARSKLVSTLLNTSHSTMTVFPWNLLNRSHTIKPNLGLHGKQPKGSAFLLGCHSFATALFGGKLERIPYSRKFCLVSTLNFESRFRRNFLKKKMEWALPLPSSDWRVGRAESVARKIIAAMNDGLMLDKAYKINGNVYEPSRPKMCEQRRLIWEPVTEHLNGREWEVVVVENAPPFFAAIAPGMIISAKVEGPITPEQETMIAILVGYEIGKVVAKILWRLEFMLQIYEIFITSMAVGMPIGVIFGVVGITDCLISLPVVVLSGILSGCFRLRRNFAEASHIGLLLMASAGYDPRLAPVFYQYICKEKGGLFSFHYSGDKIAKLLERKEVMQEAIEIYEEASAGKGIRRFV